MLAAWVFQAHLSKLCCKGLKTFSQKLVLWFTLKKKTEILRKSRRNLAKVFRKTPPHPPTQDRGHDGLWNTFPTFRKPYGYRYEFTVINSDARV